MMVAVLVLASALAASPPPLCSRLDGASTVFSQPALRFVVIGEMHGTRETPAAFADLVCHAQSTGARVVVALEHPQRDETILVRDPFSD